MLSIVKTSPDRPCPSSFNLACYVLEAGNAPTDKTALAVIGGAEDEVWSYGALRAAVRGTATGLLQQGLRPGARVLLRLGNTADFPIAYLGAIAAGLVVVPASSQLTEAEITSLAADLAPDLVVQDPAVSAPAGYPSVSVGQLRDWRALPPAEYHMGDPNRPAYIVFTSGTSGKARGVVHAHRAIWARRMMHDGWYALRPDDRLMHAGAFNWTFTLGTGLMDPWTLGATALIPDPRVEAERLPALLAQYDASIFAAAPGVFRKVLRAQLPQMPTLRHALSAGEKLPESTRVAWKEATGTDIYEAFGMSECSTFLSACAAAPASPDMLGRPQKGRHIALIGVDGAAVEQGEVGTIAVHRSDAGLMLGYLNAPEETAARYVGEWFLTGDMGRMEPSGEISYQGRNDDMMNAGGFRVSPLEVEAVFQHVEGITQVAACSVQLKEAVQVIALFYSAEAPVQESTLQALASDKLARYKQPRMYIYRDTLPVSANGKLLRKVLRESFEASDGQT